MFVVAVCDLCVYVCVVWLVLGCVYGKRRRGAPPPLVMGGLEEWMLVRSCGVMVHVCVCVAGCAYMAGSNVWADTWGLSSRTPPPFPPPKTKHTHPHTPHDTHIGPSPSPPPWRGWWLWAGRATGRISPWSRRRCSVYVHILVRARARVCVCVCVCVCVSLYVCKNEWGWFFCVNCPPNYI